MMINALPSGILLASTHLRATLPLYRELHIGLQVMALSTSSVSQAFTGKAFSSAQKPSRRPRLSRSALVCKASQVLTQSPCMTSNTDIDELGLPRASDSSIFGNSTDRLHVYNTSGRFAFRKARWPFATP